MEKENIASIYSDCYWSFIHAAFKFGGFANSAAHVLQGSSAEIQSQFGIYSRGSAFTQ